jgi:Ca-dependent carbohydrate-binding module xylan-binding
MRRKKFIILIIVIISIFFTVYLLRTQAFNYMSAYLSKSEQVNADILIVEGWLPDYALKMAFDELKKKDYKYIITTGINVYTPYFNVYGNGYLTYYTRNKFTKLKEAAPHSIEVDAFGSLEGENRAHFNLYINDSLAADFYAEKQKKNFEIKWGGNLNDIDSIRIQFTNDGMGDYGDRNLFVKEITIDHKLTIPYLNNTVYQLAKIYGRSKIINNVTSAAVLAKNRLVLLGIDSSRITPVPSKRVRANRTLTSALAFRDWIKTENPDISGINIISLGTHARRTWMTYNKILNEKYEIGIISLPDNINRYSPLRKAFKTVRETLGIIYYWIILLPY